MKDSKSPSTGKRRLLLWSVGLLLAYTVIGFLILPPIVRHVAVKQLSQQLDRPVSIESVKINPFVLSTTVRGLLIKDKDGQPFVSWDEVYVNFQLSSFFGHAWVFKEISTTRPFIRAEMNRDGTFNFSDLITKFSTNAAPAKPEASQPLALHVGRLHIGGATASVADFTPRQTFKRTIGPLDITLDNFSTDTDSKNPYAFAGTTDAGEKIAWSGYFYLTPLRSEGELQLFNFTLNKYAPLYQDLVRFDIRDGTLALDLKYRLELNASNRVVIIHDSAVGLRDFKAGQPGDSNNLIELPVAAVTGVNVDVQNHEAVVKTVRLSNAKFSVRRESDNSINAVELAKPSATSTNVPGGVLFLLRSVTNAVALLLNSTNDWRGTVADVDVTNCELHLADLAPARPARLDLTEISLTAKNLSNLAGTNLDAELSLRWNTNGSIKTAVAASFQPMTVDVQLDLDHLDLAKFDGYLASKLDLFILDSEINLHGKVRLRPQDNGLPVVSFQGDSSLENFHTVDGTFGEDLLKWDALRFNGIIANLNPPLVAMREIDLDHAYARLIIETNHTINLLNVLRLTNTNELATNNAPVAISPAKPAATNTALPQISIGAIVITNTAISFSDRSIKPEVNLSLRDVHGSVAGLSTEQLQHADLDLHAVVDGVGPADITGHINPFNSQQTNVVKISLKGMDLTPASPYAGKFAGYGIAGGKLNLDLEYTIIGKQLHSKNVITLDRFTFGEKVDSPAATHLPVRLAIAILKDRNGQIVLDVPIEGRLDDPQFRIRKVVLRAIENILEKVATSPFSLIGALFGGGGEELGYQDFAPGSAELTVADKQKLDSLQKALFARPALNLEIAGSIDPDGDREGLQRVALDQQIREHKWQELNQTERATNSADQLVFTTESRARWVQRLYDEAVTSGKITAEFIAAQTNLASLVASGLPKSVTYEKGAMQLMKRSAPVETSTNNSTAYQTKLVPPPDAAEALLLVTIPISDDDLEALAHARAKAAQDYLVASGKVEAGRLFLKAGNAENLRRDGSRVYLQFQ